MHPSLAYTLIAITFLPTPAVATPTECVVLLHGLARTSRSMSKLETALKDQGYIVKNIDYSSRKEPIETLAPDAVGRGIEACRAIQASKIHFVTHSMGGILVRYYLSQNSVSEIGRVVMLAPPNQGSEVVDKFSSMPGYNFVNGPAGRQLGTGIESVPNKLGAVTYPVGVIDGTVTVNPILSTSFNEQNDGKVSLARTKVEGMTDFISIPASHPFIARNPRAIQQVIHFIATGHFAPDVP